MHVRVDVTKPRLPRRRCVRSSRSALADGRAVVCAVGRLFVCKQSLRGVQKCLHLIDLDFTGLADQAMADILMENSARSRASGLEVINQWTFSFLVCVLYFQHLVEIGTSCPNCY